jgi:biopolymer transport protein ExbD
MAFDPKAPSKSKRHHEPPTPMPKMTSLMDMFTIMLLFILVQFFATGEILKKAAGVQLPTSSAKSNPVRDLSVVLLPKGLFVDTGTNRVETLALPDELNDQNILVIPGLTNFLKNYQRGLAARGKDTFKGVITIQGDRRVSYQWLLKVIQTCVSNDFNTFDFVVIRI